MDPIVVVALIGVLTSVLGAVVAGIFGLMQGRQAKRLAAETHKIIKGNGHGTVTDMVDLIRQSQEEMLLRLGKLMERTDAHANDSRAHEKLVVETATSLALHTQATAAALAVTTEGVAAALAAKPLPPS